MNGAMEKLRQATNLGYYIEPTLTDLIRVRASEFPDPYGLSIVSERQFSWVESHLEFDTFSSSIIETINNSLSENLQDFQESAGTFSSVGVDYIGDLGGLIEFIDISQFSSRVYLDEKNSIENALELSILSIAIPLSLLFEKILGIGPVGEDALLDEEAFVASLDEEGREIYSISKRHERSRSNRALAIQIHGKRCKACSFDFDEFYGSIAQGYIEVHHLLPVSMMSVPSVVDPRTELVPLCANCHRMVHRRWPPYSLGELRNQINPSCD